MRTSRRRLAALLAVSLALVGAACGNEGDDDAADAPADEESDPTEAGGDGESPAGDDRFAGLERIEEPEPCTPAPGVSDTEIKVGAIAVESGPQAISFAPALDGLRARVEKANQEGELGDRTINLVTRDDAADQTRNGEVARDLVEQENVFGVVSLTSVSGGSADYLHEQGVPVTGWHVGVPAWGIHENMFTFRQPAAAEPEETYTTRNNDLLKEYGATKVALIGGGNQSSASFIQRIRRSIEELGELEVVYENYSVPVEQRDFTAEAQEIIDSGADGLFTGMDTLQNTGISDALAQAGAEMKIVVFPGGYDPRVLGLPGMDGAVFGLEFIPFEMSPPSFVEFDEWAPAEVPRGQIPYIGWLSGEIFIQGLKEAGLNCPTREAFITNLRLLDDYDGGGAFADVDLSDDFGEEFRCAYYVKVENGAFVPQFDGEPFCGEPIDI